MSFVVGIDPGFTGGIAFLNSHSLFVFDTPTYETEFVKKVKGKQVTKKRNHMDLLKVSNIINEFDVGYAFLELVSARENQGVTGMFRFGENYGQWQGILAGLNIETHLVIPQIWKKHFKLLGKEKYDSLELARELFTGNLSDFKYKKNHGKAEAALIAKYGIDNKP